MKNHRYAAGSTLLEVLIAMLIIGMVASGILTAFVFSRRIGWRSSTELSGGSLVTEVAESLRDSILGTLPNGISLEPGIYVGEDMNDDGGNVPAGAIETPGLSLPADFQRFRTAPGSAGATVAANNHADGRLVVVEQADENLNGIADEDLDGDGQIGLDVDGDGRTDLERVRIRVKWTSPTT